MLKSCLISKRSTSSERTYREVCHSLWFPSKMLSGVLCSDFLYPSSCALTYPAPKVEQLQVSDNIEIQSSVQRLSTEIQSTKFTQDTFIS